MTNLQRVASRIRKTAPASRFGLKPTPSPTSAPPSLSATPRPPADRLTDRLIDRPRTKWSYGSFDRSKRSTDRRKRNTTEEEISPALEEANRRLQSNFDKKDWGNFDLVVQEMQAAEVAPNLETMGLRLNAYERQSRVSEVIRAWDETRKRGIEPDFDVYTPYAMALIREGKTKDLEIILKEMEDKKIPFHIEFYNRALHVCTSVENWEGFIHWAAKLQESKLEMEESSYIALLNGFRRMNRAGFVAETWNHLMKSKIPYKGYCVYGSWLYSQEKHAEFEELMARMKKTSSPPNATFWNYCASGILELRNWVKFDETIKKIKSMGLADGNTYGMVFQAYELQNRWLDSITNYQEFKDNKFKDNSQFVMNYSYAIVASLEAENPEFAFVVYDDMIKAAIQPNAVMFNRFFSACIRTRQWRVFAEWDEKMKEAGVEPSLATKNIRKAFQREFRREQYAKKEKEKQEREERRAETGQRKESQYELVGYRE